MHVNLSPQQFSLFLMVQVKFVQFVQHLIPLLIAELRSPDTTLSEPAFVQMQTVTVPDLRSCVRDDPPLPWPLLDRYAL
jgi:hypothetical protein